MFNQPRISYVLGVSLGNRVFTEAFANRLFEWLKTQPVTKLDVLLGDSLERINYRVRRGVPEEVATRMASKRAEELRRVFSVATDTGGARVNVLLESESGYRECREFEKAKADLNRAYERRGQVYRDVNHQVQRNLLHVTDQRLVSERLEELAIYVLEEVALFYSYFMANPSAVEIYPGENLLVKDKFFVGQYDQEGCSGRLVNLPMFINISDLIPNTNHSHAAA